MGNTDFFTNDYLSGLPVNRWVYLDLFCPFSFLEFMERESLVSNSWTAIKFWILPGFLDGQNLDRGTRINKPTLAGKFDPHNNWTGIYNLYSSWKTESGIFPEKSC